MQNKSLVKYQVQRFFANEVKSALEKGNAGENVENDLHVSEIKAIHAKCKYLYLIHTIEWLTDHDYIVGAFDKKGEWRDIVT